MNHKCPKCGSGDVAEILRGMPHFTEQLEKDIADHKIVLGGCCVTENDPSFHCNACGKEFGKPPVLRKCKRQSNEEPRELFPDAVTGVVFEEGGFFGGYDHVEIKKSTDEKYYAEYRHNPEVRDREDLFRKELTDLQWKRLMNTLFYRLCIHEWKQSYYDHNVLDGTQWSLELSLTKGRHYNISGSNAFPAMYKDLVRVFKRYMRKKP